MPSATFHLRPNAAVADRVLLPGDPGRAMRLAQLLLAEPRMLNHNRGLWGYTGTAADGDELTVQSTGMGGPSAAIVCEELIALGARRLIRVGTCAALVAGPALGDLLVADGALARDGASRALGGDGTATPDPELHAALRAAGNGARAGLVVSADLFYDPQPERAAAWVADGALAVEMETATVFRVAARHGVAAACVLAVSDQLAGGGRERIEAAALEQAEQALGRVAAAALGVPV
ncbi:MAG: purine-nucleoside phosphorylase [Solirubrobacteraceae bacterium]|nr:purine-nucleoside phosphorylase [Solirubrobacteraceae bacterium]